MPNLPEEFQDKGTEFDRLKAMSVGVFAGWAMYPVNVAATGLASTAIWWRAVKDLGIRGFPMPSSSPRSRLAISTRIGDA